MKRFLPKKIYLFLVTLYAKIVPFWFVKLLTNRTAPMRLRYRFIKELSQKNSIPIFIETGTYLGDTTASLSDIFKKIITFEISTELVDLARKRFFNKPQIEVICGDSGTELEKVLASINEKTIFWLDGHYSEGFLYAKEQGLETPIKKEIHAIFTSPIKKLNNIILIDDAFEFDGTRGYPTLCELKDFVYKYVANYIIVVRYNIIFIVPESLDL